MRGFRMESVPGEAAAAVERHPCPGCAAPAGSACRTRAGRTAAKYHTARFILVPALREELTVAVPADRGPGKPLDFRDLRVLFVRVAGRGRWVRG